MNPLISDRWDKARRSDAILKLLPMMNFESMITHRYALDQAAEAYLMVDSNPQDLLQVVLTYERS